MYETVWLLGPDLGAQEGLWGPGHRGNLQRFLRKLSNSALRRAPETSPHRSAGAGGIQNGSAEPFIWGGAGGIQNGSAEPFIVIPSS